MFWEGIIVQILWWTSAAGEWMGASILSYSGIHNPGFKNPGHKYISQKIRDNVLANDITVI